jgi:hypothetical protein
MCFPISFSNVATETTGRDAEFALASVMLVIEDLSEPVNGNVVTVAGLLMV